MLRVVDLFCKLSHSDISSPNCSVLFGGDLWKEPRFFWTTAISERERPLWAWEPLIRCLWTSPDLCPDTVLSLWVRVRWDTALLPTFLGFEYESYDILRSNEDMKCWILEIAYSFTWVVSVLNCPRMYLEVILLWQHLLLWKGNGHFSCITATCHENTPNSSGW